MLLPLTVPQTPFIGASLTVIVSVHTTLNVPLPLFSIVRLQV